MEERAFKNTLEDYRGSTFLGEDKKLQKQYQEQVLTGVRKLQENVCQNASDDGRDYSVYTGAAGQALLCLQLHTKLPGGDKDDHYLQQALTWLKPCLKRLKGSKLSFLCGDAGPLAIAAVVHHLLGNKERSKTFISKVEDLCRDVCADSDMPDEILYGRCGYLSALLFLQHYLSPDAVDRELIVKVVEAVLSSGETLSRRQRCSHPLMYEWHDKPYLGAAHGLAGIYYMLLQVKEAGVQERVRQLVHPCVDFMLSLRFASGNCPSSLGSSGGDRLVHWCHGAPGWVHLFALAYKIYKDKRYLEAALDCGRVVWQRGLLCKGYGLCHGTAGNAYTFLTLFKLTGEQRYLYYAYKFAEWCCDYGKHGCRTPDRPFSMFEGMAGTVYFLVDLLDPYKSAFPAFDFM
ncbi:lanC-like protein 2 [Aplysia californica]|uniref:LanC-like protein 2 n=1 Tax=Aplysia californica TaxID=6500 RepID=A0ABM0JP90_APLCA|nr:lanC-like protein 2 [Aplysia californica]